MSTQIWSPPILCIFPTLIFTCWICYGAKGFFAHPDDSESNGDNGDDNDGNDSEGDDSDIDDSDGDGDDSDSDDGNGHILIYDIAFADVGQTVHAAGANVG